ncbi:MAG: hypothetical protein HQK52_00865 [Oligoflexia bacterium]|nr:hypothetical protein [Oligoflexia bacterium]
MNAQNTSTLLKNITDKLSSSPTSLWNLITGFENETIDPSALFSKDELNIFLNFPLIRINAIFFLRLIPGVSKKYSLIFSISKLKACLFFFSSLNNNPANPHKEIIEQVLRIFFDEFIAIYNQTSNPKFAPLQRRVFEIFYIVHKILLSSLPLKNIINDSNCAFFQEIYPPHAHDYRFSIIIDFLLESSSKKKKIKDEFINIDLDFLVIFALSNLDNPKYIAHLSDKFYKILNLSQKQIFFEKALQIFFPNKLKTASPQYSLTSFERDLHLKDFLQFKSQMTLFLKFFTFSKDECSFHYSTTAIYNFHLILNCKSTAAISSNEYHSILLYFTPLFHKCTHDISKKFLLYFLSLLFQSIDNLHSWLSILKGLDSDSYKKIALSFNFLEKTKKLFLKSGHQDHATWELSNDIFKELKRLDANLLSSIKYDLSLQKHLGRIASSVQKSSSFKSNLINLMNDDNTLL